jgi:hypothetical protein
VWCAYDRGRVVLLCCCQVVVVASSDWRCAGMTDSVLGCSVGLVEGPVEGENKVYSKLACLFGCHVSAVFGVTIQYSRMEFLDGVSGGT